MTPPGPPDLCVLVNFCPVPDDMTEDGEVLYKQPYSFVVTQQGYVLQQSFWRGRPRRVVGFARDVTRHRVDLPWDELIASDLRDAENTYCVLEDWQHMWMTSIAAVSSIGLTSVEFDATPTPGSDPSSDS